jgi:oligopeptide transport system substrate-binding protein
MTPTPTPTPDVDTDSVDQIFRLALNQSSDDTSGFSGAARCSSIPGVFSGLTRVAPDFRIEPDWAEIWEPGEDGARWIFHIREDNAGWSDGSSVTAHDFVRAWRRLIGPGPNSKHAAVLFDLQNARDVHQGVLPSESLGVRAEDDWTLVVDLERLRSSFPAVAASPILSPFGGPDLDRMPDELGDGVKCITNGPFRVSDVLQDQIVLKPFESYWESSAAVLDRVEVAFLTPGRAINRFQSEDVDFIRVEDADLPRARADGRLSAHLQRGIPTKIWCLVPQVDVAPFNELGVRRALGKVIDRRRLELIVEGRVSEATTLVPVGLFPDYDEVSPNIAMQFNVDEALDEIARTPYADPVEWPELRLAIPDGNSYRERLARDTLDQIYENLGVEIGIEVLDPEEYQNGLIEGQFPLTWMEWTYRYPDPACGYADLFASWARVGQEIDWEDEGYDELVRLADTVADAGDRAEIYARCESLLQDRAVYIPLVHPVEHFLLQSWVTGVPTTGGGRLVQPGSIYNRLPPSLMILERS